MIDGRAAVEMPAPSVPCGATVHYREDTGHGQETTRHGAIRWQVDRVQSHRLW